MHDIEFEHLACSYLYLTNRKLTYYAFFMSLKVVTLRDLTNVQVSMTLSRDGNNVATVVDHLKSMDGMFYCIYVKPCGCLCFCEVVV